MNERGRKRLTDDWMDSSDNNSLKQLYEAQSSAEAFQAEDVDDDDREHGEEDRAKEAVDDAEDDE